MSNHGGEISEEEKYLTKQIEHLERVQKRATLVASDVKADSVSLGLVEFYNKLDDAIEEVTKPILEGELQSRREALKPYLKERLRE